MAGTDSFPEKHTIFFSESTLLIQNWGSEAYVQIWDNDMCSILVDSNVVCHHDT